MSALERTVSGMLASWSAVHYRLPGQCLKEVKAVSRERRRDQDLRYQIRV